MNPNAPARNSSKTLIIVLVVGGVLVVLVAAVIIAAAIGIYVFSDRTSAPERDYDPPRPASTRTPSDRAKALKTTSNGDKTNELVEELKQKPTIGGFSLQNIIPQHSNRVFDASQGEVKGIYTANGRTVSFFIAEYSDRARAAVEFGRMVGRERSRGATITDQIRVAGGAINAAFTNGKNKNVAFCEWPDNEPVKCHLIGSEDEQALAAFRDGLSTGR